ncbi:glutathione peroxidase [Pseudothauera nasutitermitis]|uniref:Glutathione peroxidase n=1 Tax=Pseudothauera nasutitermitis TaxID=2565930 RepID=A0A4S4B2X4_9RHOO|nr:glutathione peroxidase [Pseudothauera nasutitermitis]THF66080.1 glutathione peroxidase [Pseudothauera nasutitermitis]
MSGETSVFDFELRALDGSPLPLSRFRGQVLLLVNVASRCGFTPQYEGLQALQARYAARGFTVIGFPCNQFGAQEPGSAGEIAEFCSTRFAVDFPLSEKIEVNGPAAHPLYRHLRAEAPGVLGTEAIKWNFTKFLVDREGRVVERFAPATDPAAIAGEIERLLDAPIAGSAAQ